MKAPRKDRGKRLTDAKGREAKRAADAAVLASSPAGQTILGGAALLPYDPARRGEEADAALTLYRNDKMLIRAFQEFGLNPANPHHWKLLAQYLAEALFADSGRPAKWTAAALRDFVSAVDQEIAAGPGRATDRAIEKIQKTGRYRSVTFETLRRRYYDAKKPRLVRK
ncbi:hypothetical protein XI07_13115 [Bradyrhizobium sp. CCBAU 11445]|uniref:hypothetical protein n=1 Tax=Bradyrhizobium sp. CCBAU 11445 TaxID=1630896 RepID=UPI002305ED4C|nr:hypothetical protein [Bradyrhizobium sp. CCBAU 11445]MDA9482953.1 hypothetical protein [Bradyrhizobium sp. CCBAU 11445]